MRLGALVAAIVLVLLAATACAANDASSHKQREEPKQERTQTAEGNGEGAPEPTDAVVREGARQDKGPDYAELIDGVGALTIEVPPSWVEAAQKGATSEEGAGWTTYASVPVTSSITAAPDIDAWMAGVAPTGVYAVASASLLRDYGVEALVDYASNDASATCTPGERNDLDRDRYSGFIQLWTNCGGRETASLLTLSAAPEGGGCVVLAQVGANSEADREAARHLFDTFEVDCERVSELEASVSASPASPEATVPTQTVPDPASGAADQYDPYP